MNYAIKTRATRACYAMSRSKKYQKYRRQAGVTLIELMVGIAIGLMVVAVALGALMVSRGVSGTVSDASNIQQQAAYAMRVIGAQIRQAGSLYINMTYQTNNADPYLAQVAIETSAPASGTYNAFEPSTDTIKGASDSMTIGYRRYKETVTNPANPGQDESQSRNCIGGPANNSDDKRLESIFRYNPATATLSCSGNDPAASPQPIIQNVANFEVRYLLQDNSTQGDSKVKRVLAAGVGADWNKVQGIEVCLVLYGNEAIDLPSGSKYPDCDGDGELKDIPQTGERARRMHMVFRNVFQLRSQGLT